MKYGPNKCKVCGKDSGYVNHKCDPCRGVRTQEELSKLSVVEQIKLAFQLEKEIDRLSDELSNLNRQCKHPELTKKHLHYDRWLDEIVDTNIHSNQEDSFVWCVVCGEGFGWFCSKNPKGYCEYPSNFEEEAVHGCSILHCVHCKKPKNRWIDLEAAREKVSYVRPTDEEIDGQMEKILVHTKKVPYVELTDYKGYNFK